MVFMGLVRSRLIVLLSLAFLSVGGVLAIAWWRGPASSRASGFVTPGLLMLSALACSGAALAAVAQRRRKDALELLGRTFRASPNAILITTLAAGRILDVNEAFTRMMGFSREEALGRTTFDLKLWVDPTERDMLVAVLRERGTVSGLEARFRRKSGEIRVSLISGALIEYRGETCLLGYSTDITDRQRAEEERQRLLLGAGEARHTAEVLSLANLALTQHLSLEAVLDTFLEHLRRLVPYDSANVMLVEDGHTFAVRALRGYDAPDRDAVLRIRFDLLHNRITERLFRTRQSILVPDSRSDADWEFVRGAEHVRSWLGVPLIAGGQLIGIFSLDKREPDFFTTAHMQLAESLAAQAASAVRNTLLFEERRQAGEALQRSEARYRDLIENANDIICTLDLSEQFTSLNRIGEKITGYQVEAGRPVRIADIVAPEHLDRARELFRRALAGEAPVVDEMEIVNRAGQRITLELSGRAFYEQGQPGGVQVIARDVTERKHLELELRQSQKMEAIGLLAGGVAHDFNTLLGVICGHCELLSLRSDIDKMLRHRIEEIATAAQRAAELTRQLLAFSRKQLLQLKVLDLNATVTEMANTLRRLIGERITLLTRLAPDLGPIKADPSQIAQVIINLAVNARDAMPQGGTLTLETANRDLDEDYARHNASVTPGPYVMLAVSDTGVGMDKDSLAHIFEPFYTTKELGKGAGLGLATVYGMIRQGGGHIAVHSVPGRGTSFAIFFPRVANVDRSAVTDKAGRSAVTDKVDRFAVTDTADRSAVKGMEMGMETTALPPLAGTSKGETILLVEDDATQRELVRACLLQAGYTVLVAADGYAALEIAAKHLGPIDLVLTDVVMPGLSGPEVARRLRERWPQAKVLYVSGFVDTAALPPESPGREVAFLEKPFRMPALTRKLRELLEQQSE